MKNFSNVIAISICGFLKFKTINCMKKKVLQQRFEPSTFALPTSETSFPFQQRTVSPPLS